MGTTRMMVARVLGFGVIALGASLPAAAQTVPKVEMSGGYQFLNLSIEGENEALGKGWYVDIAGNVTRSVGVVFEVGGNYKSLTSTESFQGATGTATADLRLHEFMGGVRFNARQNPTIVPFGQVLVGGVRLSAEVSATGSVGGIPIVSFSEEDSQTNLAVQAGGGVNVLLADQVGIRVGLDYLRVFEEDSGANVFRFAAGIVLLVGG